MIIFKREIEYKIIQNLFKRGIVIILGPRQSGKTTLSKKIIEIYKDEGQYFNCEFAEVRSHFALGKPDLLLKLIGNKKIVVFDEAQTIENIGKILKVFYDTYPDIQIIATGSSSFDLSNKINEPLTGRAFEFMLPPLSLNEINSSISVDRDFLNTILQYGSYPAIVGMTLSSDKELELKKIATNYLYKDIYVFESIKNPKIFEDLLKILAYQIGSTISVNQIARDLGTSPATVERYIRLLEQSYVIKRIYSYSGNFTNELKKSFKIYFMDLGVRNVLCESLSKINDRKDFGVLFENFFVIEMYKRYSIETFPPRITFWRTRQGLEIDMIAEKDGKLHAYECKWSDTKVSFKTFLKHYPESIVEVITPEVLINNLSSLSLNKNLKL